MSNHAASDFKDPYEYSQPVVQQIVVAHNMPSKGLFGPEHDQVTPYHGPNKQPENTGIIEKELLN